MTIKYKRLLALTLTISMLCSVIPAFALENQDVSIDLIDEIPIKYDVELPDTIPQIEISDDDILPTESNITLFNLMDTSESEIYNGTPNLSMPKIDTIEIPEKQIELDDNWVSVNEIDEEDLKKIEALRANRYERKNNLTVESTARINSNTRTTSSASSDASYRITNINSKDTFALQNQTGRTNYIGDNIGNEYIDPMTGNLIVTETDLILPGVDGHDLKLSRYYSLAQAELYTKTAGICTESKTYILPDNWYIVTEEIYNTQTFQTSLYYYAYSEYDSAQAKIREIETRDNCNGLYMYDASWEFSIDGDTITFDYYITSEITSSSYQTICSNLGAGWSWSFPSVQTVKDNYNDSTEIPKAIYYHDGKGNTYEVDCDDFNNYYFTNYVGKNIVFDTLGDYYPNICNTSRIDYMVEDDDCTKYYFGPHGEIRSIIDVHGNKIEFSYTYKDFYGVEDWPVISGITDSVGRDVEFRYTTVQDYDFIEVTVTSPFESEKNIALTYKKKMIDVTYMDEYLSTEPFLESVEYPNGESTKYFPASVSDTMSYAYPLKFTFADKSFNSEYVINTSGYTNTLIYLLGNIIRSHSSTYYYYDLCERNLGHSGITQAYRISERGDDLLVVPDGEDIVVDGYTSNRVQYRYSRDYTGYPDYNSVENIEDDEYVCRVTEERENATFEREFYKKDDAVLEYEEIATYNNPVGSPLVITNTVEDYHSKMPILVKKSYSNNSDYNYDSYQYYDMSTYGNKTYGKPLLQTEELDYDTVFSSERDKHGFSYTYDGDTGFLLSKSWYKSDYSECTESFTYDSQGRLISYKDPEDTIITYAYEYTGDKVSKKTTTVENDTGTTVVVENYTSATSYAFPSTVVKTVTSDNITNTETTSYTYDMLYGVVKTMTDNDGNTTYYEYDELGRLTKIIYPVYSTYSAYGNKNIKILPIEDIIYQTFSYKYSGVIGSNENLILQGIKNDVTYYDVSNVDVSNPEILDLSGLSTTFYASKQNCYLGTGEIIESNVLDTVNGSTAINTTTYYYDTVANTVSVVNPKGNATITQYDGAGREVKITDEFDNYHITEYNISGDSVGFKSLSYMTSAIDRTTKQNVIENTYDRLGRTAKEKGYSSYPDTSVEVCYEYDFVGNVIGIKDANNNLNEDGYTQTNTYDKLNRVTSSKNANNEIIRNTYDLLGNIKKQTITDSSGTQSVLYQRSYNGDGKIVSDTDNAGNSNLYVYDDMGRLHISQDKSLKQSSFGYNELGTLDLTSNTNPGDSIIARNYAFKNPFGASTVIDVRGIYNDSVGQYQAYINEITQYSYTPTGNLTEQYGRYAIDTGMDDVDFNPYVYYQYDSTGNIVSALHGIVDNVNETIWGATTHYEYDKNRLSKVQIDGEDIRNTADSVNVSYEYYDDGKLKSVTYPTLTDGSVLKTVYVYDGLSRLTSLTNYKGTEVLSNYTYTYDNNGNILTTTENVGTTQNSIAYTYDKLNRIASVAGTKGADSYYEYDVRGNRKVNFEQIDFLSEESAIFTYDAEDMLDYSQVGSDVTYFEYSSNGYRYFKKENSSYPEYYIYDPEGRLQAIAAAARLSMTDGSTMDVMFPITHYIWGLDRVLAKIDKTTNKSYYYLYNGHGDVVQIVDTSGVVKNTYDYDVWGNFLKKEETIENHFTYFGQTYDEITGLYYLRARYYDPTTGRFTQQDSAEDGYNWYVYGNQNPVMYVDYSGNEALTISTGLVLLGLAVVYTGGVYVFKALQSLSSELLNEVYRSQAYRQATYSNRSDEINWGNDNTHHHTLQGSKGTKNSHGPIWKKFNIDPNNNNDWSKLLPILKTVLDVGDKISNRSVYEHGKVIGHYVEYAKTYVDKGVEVIVKIYVNLKGEIWFSDAYGKFLN